MENDKSVRKIILLVKYLEYFRLLLNAFGKNNQTHL